MSNQNKQKRIDIFETPKSPEDVSKKKHEKLNLNEKTLTMHARFTQFIERTHQLEKENAKLHQEAEALRKLNNGEKDRVKSECESNLSKLRKAIDKISREKAKLDIDYVRMEERRDILLSRCDKKNKNLQDVENLNKSLEERYLFLTKDHDEVVKDLIIEADSTNVAEMKQSDLLSQIEAVKLNLDEEVLKRVELENAIQSLREEISFRKVVYEKQCNELSGNYEDIEKKLAQKYESKLQKALNQQTDQYEINLERHRQEYYDHYEKKLKYLDVELKRVTKQGKLRNEMKLAENELKDLNERIKDLEEENSKLNFHFINLNSQLDKQRLSNRDSIKRLEQEIIQIQEESVLQLQSYTDLIDAKLALDNELSKYDKLLTNEDTRLCNVLSKSASISTNRTLSAEENEPKKLVTEKIRKQSPIKNKILADTLTMKSEKTNHHKRKQIAIAKEKENDAASERPVREEDLSTPKNPSKIKSFLKIF